MPTSGGNNERLASTEQLQQHHAADPFRDMAIVGPPGKLCSATRAHGVHGDIGIQLLVSSCNAAMREDRQCT